MSHFLVSKHQESSLKQTRLLHRLIIQQATTMTKIANTLLCLVLLLPPLVSSYGDVSAQQSSRRHLAPTAGTLNVEYVASQNSDVWLSECQGDCAGDFDCAEGLACFQRASMEFSEVPGCKGGGTMPTWDFCYKHYDSHGNLELIYPTPADLPSGNTLAVCQGDCDSDSDCDPGLKCYQRGSGLVPGCGGTGPSDRSYDGFDFCYDPWQGADPPPPTATPTAMPTVPPLVYVGNDGLPVEAFPLQECQGDCDLDSDCGEGPLLCFQRSGTEPVPGCSGPGQSGTDYCYNAGATVTTLRYMGNDGIPAAQFPLGKCHGDCDSDNDCVGDLLCFQRDGTEAVPGCEGDGEAATGRDYCYDPSPTNAPGTDAPVPAPTDAPVLTATPTKIPTALPTKSPTASPTKSPTAPPMESPTTATPTKSPTASPTKSPTASPTKSPTASPTKSPTAPPMESPTTATPTKSPTASPTKSPTASPTKSPTASPTKSPTAPPMESPTTATPTKSPTASPTKSPTASPTKSPTASPTKSPTASPTKSPTASPTKSPTASPTKSPTASPTKSPTAPPTKSPTSKPTPPPVPAVWEPKLDEDFENNQWTTGSEAKITNKFAYTGSDSLELKEGDSGSDAAIGTSGNISVSGYSRAKVDFWYYFKDSPDSDELILEWSSNNGSTWQVVENFICGVDADTGVWTHPEVIWSLNGVSTLKIRLRAELTNKKKVYIDEVKLYVQI